jgi:hypothetical protein
MTIHLRDATKIKEVPVVPRNRTALGELPEPKKKKEKKQ